MLQSLTNLDDSAYEQCISRIFLLDSNQSCRAGRNQLAKIPHYMNGEVKIHSKVTCLQPANYLQS